MITVLTLPVEMYPLAAIELASLAFDGLIRNSVRQHDDDVIVSLEVLEKSYAPEMIEAEFLNYVLDASAQLSLEQGRP